MTTSEYFQQEFLQALRDLAPDAALAAMLAAAYADEHRAIERNEQDLQRIYKDIATRLPKVAEFAGMRQADLLSLAEHLSQRYMLPLGSIIALLQTFFNRKQGIKNEQQQKPGVILHLYHGRANPFEKLEDWGTDGPHIPCEYAGFTYATLWIVQNEQRIDLELVGDLVKWEGVYYGDFEIIPIENADSPGSVIQQPSM